MPDPDQSTAVYRCFDAVDDLLYVGMTANPDRRFAAHARYSEWWPLTARTSIEWFDSRDAAGAAEKTAIKTERPRYNGTHATSPMLALLPPRDYRRVTGRRGHQDPRPVEAQIAAELRFRIIEGALPVDARFPTTAELMERFGVSNMTIQRALKLLKEQGFARGKVGSGVFVASPVPPDFGNPLGHTRRIVAEEESVPASHGVAVRLRVPEGQSVVRRERLISANGVPIELVESYAPTTPAGEAAEALEEVSCRPPTTHEFELLEMPRHTAVLVIDRLHLTREAEPVELERISRPSHLHQLRYSTTFDERNPRPEQADD